MIYDNIVELAKKRNMPLYKIEKEAGLANGVISKWKSNSPQVDNLMAVKAFDTLHSCPTCGVGVFINAKSCNWCKQILKWE